MVYLIAQILFVAGASWLLTKKYFGIDLFSDSILVSFILFFAQIVLVEIFLGSIAKLYFPSLFIAHLLILLLILLMNSSKKMPVFRKPNLEFIFDSKLLLFAAAVFLSFFLVKVFYNLINSPLDADSLLYHLAFPAAWIKSGSLDTPFFIFGSSPVMVPGSLAISSPSYFPINADLFFTWLMLPLRNAFLADLGEVPFYFIGMLTVYSILRKYNLNQKIALLSGFLLMLIPNIFKQLKTAAQIDVICAVLFLLVIFTILLLKSNFTLKNAALFGITSGIFIGTKFNNLVWMLTLLPLIFYILYKGIRVNKLSMGKIVSFLGAIGLMTILFGGYMYIKNYILTANPIFPVDLKIFGKVIFKGLVDSTAYKMQLFTSDAHNFLRVFREGLGLQFFTLILPCTFLPLIFYLKIKTKPWYSKELLLLFLTPLLSLILFKVFIDIYITRYLFPYLCLGLLTAVIFIVKLPRGENYFYVVSFLSIFVAVFELAHRYELITSILITGLFFLLLLRYKKQIIQFYNSKIFGRVILLSLFLGSLLLAYLNNKYNNEEFNRYISSLSKNEAWQADLRIGWRALNDLTKEGAQVAYTGRQEAYPLYGTKLKNKVSYISVNNKEITPYNNPDGLYREIKDFAAWRENLKKHKIEYLFVAVPCLANREVDDPAKFPIENEWVATHPDDFQLLFGNSLSRIYRVLNYYGRK